MPQRRYFEIPFISPARRCWSCNVTQAKREIGLCDPCYDRLRDEDAGQQEVGA